MASSWMIVNRDGSREAVPLRAMTRKSIIAAARRTAAKGEDVVAAYQGGPRPIALCPQVYPAGR